MKVGDLVTYKNPYSKYSGSLGIVIRCIAGHRKVVLWMVGEQCSYPAHHLEVVNESR